MPLDKSLLPDSLIYACDEHFDICRRLVDGNFEYHNLNSGLIEDKNLISELSALSIPPNWQDVQITSIDKCHIRAFGYDEALRKQYVYHARYMALRNEKKFERLSVFGKALPAIRTTATEDLKRPAWDKKKVLGLVVLTLDKTHMRIGNTQYLKKNETYGLTTLRRKHLEIKKDELIFQYKGKSNKYRKVRVDNRQLVNLIRKSSELPGYEIFRYKSHGRYETVDSADVNEYLRDITGENFSSKDFRTWGGTVIALERLNKAEEMILKNPRKKLLSTLIKLVAKELGNTVAVCREYYIHPAVIEAIEKNTLDLLRYSDTEKDDLQLSSAEEQVLKVIGNGS